MQYVLTLHLEQRAHASSQSSVTQLLSMTIGFWHIRVSFQRPMPYFCWVMCSLYSVCAAEDCPHNVGGCWNQLHLSWLQTFHVAGHSLRLFSTKMLHTAGERLQSIIHQLCNIPRLAEVDECVHGLFVLFQLLQRSSLSSIMRLRNHNQ